MSVTRLAYVCSYLLLVLAEYVPQNRILGGHPVNITEVPYMAIYRPLHMTHCCGATIIHTRFLVSAAHCYYRMKRNGYKGYITVGTDRADEGGDLYDIGGSYPHPKFNPARRDEYDILVLKLSTSLKFSRTVQAIRLASKNFVIPDGPDGPDVPVFETMGFGVTENGSNSNQLLKVFVPYIDSKKCGNKSIRVICAGGDGKDACRGDSGGPLVYKNMLIGVVSRGNGCGLLGYYSYIPPLITSLKKL